MTDMPYANKRIKELRIEKGWTQEELGKKMGYADRTIINKYECGREMTLKKIREFADIFNTSPADILGWEQGELPLKENTDDEKKQRINLTRFSESPARNNSFAQNPQMMGEMLGKISALNEEHFNIVAKLIDEFCRIEQIERYIDSNKM